MRVWVDLANTPHVPLLEPIAERLEADGHELLLSARDHAQTLELAEAAFPVVSVIGGASPSGRLAKGTGIARRALELRRFARTHLPDVAFSHGSYAQIVAARTLRVPAVTMMDYEFQPANQLSFRLAKRVIVPAAFDEGELRKAGGRRKAVRYDGFKEELYLGRRPVDRRVRDALGVGAGNVLVVMRPAPDGALYHRMHNDRFDAVVEAALTAPNVFVVVLPRGAEQRARYRSDFPAAIVPVQAVDAMSLLALADLTIGAGGTMTRESAVLGTPTWTIFAGRLAGVDAELIARGLLNDLRERDGPPPFVAKAERSQPLPERAAAILDVVVGTIYAVVGERAE